MPAVKFVFDRAKTKLAYPLRISAYNRETPLDTLIWIISKEVFLPKGYPTEEMPRDDYTGTSYEAKLEQVMSKAGGTTFVVQYAEHIYSDYRREMIYYQVGSSDDPEMQELLDHQKELKVVRLRASLNPKGTNADLELQKSQSTLWIDAWYQTPCPNGIQKRQCPGDDDDGSVPEPDAGPANDPIDNKQNDQDDNGSDGKSEPRSSGCQITSPPSLPALSLLSLIGLALARRRRWRRK